MIRVRDDSANPLGDLAISAHAGQHETARSAFQRELYEYFQAGQGGEPPTDGLRLSFTHIVLHRQHHAVLLDGRRPPKRRGTPR